MSLQDKIDNAKETPWMGYYRPKVQIIYKFGMKETTTIVCHPRSKWLCIIDSEHNTVLHNKNVTISVPTKEFESQWTKWGNIKDDI